MSDVVPAGLGYAAGLAVAAVLVVAAVAKRADPVRTAASFRALGLGAGAAPAATAVPLAELVVAAGLVVAPGRAAPVAVGLLVAFSVVLVRALAAGVEVGCGCFGGTGRTTVSARDLARNALLVVAAALATVGGGPGDVGLADVVLVATVGMLALVVGAAWELRDRLGRLWHLDLPAAHP